MGVVLYEKLNMELIIRSINYNVKPNGGVRNVSTQTVSVELDCDPLLPPLLKGTQTDSSKERTPNFIS